MKKILRSILVSFASIGAVAGGVATVVSCGEAANNDNPNAILAQAEYDTAVEKINAKGIDLISNILTKQNNSDKTTWFDAGKYDLENGAWNLFNTANYDVAGKNQKVWFAENNLASIKAHLFYLFSTDMGAERTNMISGLSTLIDNKLDISSLFNQVSTISVKDKATSLGDTTNSGSWYFAQNTDVTKAQFSDMLSTAANGQASTFKVTANYSETDITDLQSITLDLGKVAPTNNLVFQERDVVITVNVKNIDNSKQVANQVAYNNGVKTFNDPSTTDMFVQNGIASWLQTPGKYNFADGVWKLNMNVKTDSAKKGDNVYFAENSLASIESHLFYLLSQDNGMGIAMVQAAITGSFGGVIDAAALFNQISTISVKDYVKDLSQNPDVGSWYFAQNTDVTNKQFAEMLSTAANGNASTFKLVDDQNYDSTDTKSIQTLKFSLGQIPSTIKGLSTQEGFITIKVQNFNNQI